MKSNKYTSEQLKTMVNDGTLCSVPFRTYELKQGGKHGFCCKWIAPGLTQNGKLLDVSNSTIADAWNGDEMHSIRQAMLDYKKAMGGWIGFLINLPKQSMSISKQVK